MSVAEDTVQGSYAGVSFLTTKSSVEGGRKDVVKEFPNSDIQTVEDLGLKVRTYKLEIIITSDAQGNNYNQRKNSFIRVLEKGGDDVLIHPLFGRINNVRVRTYTLIESYESLGEARFSVVFAINGSPGVPVVSGDTLSLVENAKNTSIGAISSDFSTNFSVSNSFPSNFTSATEKINEMVNTFSSATSFLSVSAEGINTFTSQLSELSENVISLTRNPTQLADSVENLFQTVDGLYASVDSTLQVMQQFFNFGLGDAETPIQQTTVGLIERARNQNLLNSLITSQSLVLAYYNASQIQFTTVEDVDEVAQILETQYQRVINGQDPVDSSIPLIKSNLSTSTKNTITDLRIQVQKFFDEQKLSVSQIIEISTKQIPSRVLAYRYYGSSELGKNIGELNQDLNVSFLEGNVDILTE